MPERDDEAAEAEGSPRRWTGKRTARLALSLLAGAALLAVVFWLADLEDVLARLRAMRVDLLGLALLAYSVTYLARARRFAAAGARASTWTLFWVVTLHGAANRLMPMKTGELIYPILAKRVGAVALGEGLVQILMLRIMDLLTVAFLFLVALALALTLGAADLGEATPAFVVAAAVLLVASVVAIARLGPLLSFLIRTARRVAARLRPGSRVVASLERAEGATRGVTDLGGRRRARVALWSLVCWSAYFLTFHLILLALGVEISPFVTVLGSSAAIVGSVVPLSGLGTFGALEGGWTAGFVAAGLDATTAASTAIVMSGVTLLFALILAAAGWVVLSLRPRPGGAASRGSPGPSGGGSRS